MVFQFGADFGPARPYVGLRYVTHSPNTPEPLGLQGGVDLSAPWKVGPCGAFDLQIAAEYAWEPAITAQAGACFVAEDHRFRLMGIFRKGPDDTGKRDGVEERYAGLLLSFDSTALLRQP